MDHLFRCVALPEVDPTLPIVMVTSWNDWNEDTGIEPIGGTPTHTDDSPGGTAYTQGYTYGGEGRAALRVLRTDTALLDQKFAKSAAGGSAGKGLEATKRAERPDQVATRVPRAARAPGGVGLAWASSATSWFRPAGATKEHHDLI